ncbi:Nuclear-pore anchor [Vigna angularis]|uniref:Nuclear-pore anchor n=1 Tax=Phaseolus angularis TaxID=3914 RepID=A0A8T0JGI5_PHAAN|nr:Nuclear-pore anchor [Vigna angularis]
MPLFLSDEEFSRCSGDGAAVAAKADAFIRGLLHELDTVRAKADAADINAEQNCSLIEQKYLSLTAEFSKLEAHVADLQSSLSQRLRELAEVEKDREIERLRMEVGELHKSKRQLIELNEQKDLELSEKNATMKSYLDKIVSFSAFWFLVLVHLSENAAHKEARLSEVEAELARCRAACSRLEQEKEIIEKQNSWLNEELNVKVNSVFELRRKNADLEADTSFKLTDELISAKDAAATNEEQLSAELSTVNKLNELYKESSKELSKKATDLEGVIKALESDLKQVGDHYKVELEKELSARKQVEKEVTDLKEKLEKFEAESEARKKTNELNNLPLSSFTTESWMESVEADSMVEENSLLVPKLPVGVSGTALAASLLRDGWSVLFELEEKAEAIIDEREEHEKMADAYSLMSQKLQNSLNENSNYEKTIQELKVSKHKIQCHLSKFLFTCGSAKVYLMQADLKRRERDYNLVLKETDDLRKQVTVLLKECRDIQLRCGSMGYDNVDYSSNTASRTITETEAEHVISEHLLTFKDINGLVEQNVQLRSLVRSLSGQIENQEVEFKEKLEMELKKHTEVAASKVAAVLQRAEEQGQMIEALHASVAMYKRLYEEEHNLHLSHNHSSEARAAFAEVGRNNLKTSIESSQKAEAKAILERNVEFSQLVVDYQRKLRESSESLIAAEELSRKLTMEASLGTIQSTEQVREEARAAERVKQEEYIRKLEKEWAEAKQELNEERENVRRFTLDRDQTIKGSLRQVEDMNKELANALRAVASAESRAAVAELVEMGEESGPSTLSSDEYKSIAEVNEDALKQIEMAHEKFKTEAEDAKKVLESELNSLREKMLEIENESSLKYEEVASETVGKEEALTSAMAEITNLKEEILTKSSQISALEIQLSGLKENLDREHQKWRAAQTNYERQVVLQSETIQELTKTSEALSLLQEEASELRKLNNTQKVENNELKARWEEEKAQLEKSRNDAERKYNEINEQNKILHSQLEAFHIRWAEKERNAAGISSGSSSADAFGDAGLQNVINYLRRSKEIVNISALAETEVSLLKQEKLRLQSQVREMNLLRESNMQLREENKHNFEECQKLRELAQKARAETDNLENALKEREIELEGCKKEIETLKLEKDNLNNKVLELLEKSKNVDVEDYDRVKKLAREIQDKLRDRDAQIEEMSRSLSEKQDSVSRLEKDLASCRLQLAEREKRIHDILHNEANLKLDLEKHRKLLAQYKKRIDVLLREKEEAGKRSAPDTTGEQAMKEEKDTRIQILEKHLERLRDELKKEKEESRLERGRRLKSEKAIKDSYNNVEQEKTKFVNEIEKHKESLKKLSDEVEKLKIVIGNIPEGSNVVQLLSGPNVDDLATSYISSVESFEKEAHSIFRELGGRGNLGDAATNTDGSTAATVQSQSTASLAAPGASSLPPKATGESEKRLALPLSKASVETRRTGRKLVRPRLVRPDEPQGDTEMSDAEGPLGKTGPSSDTETSNFAQSSQPLARKRLAPTSSSELREESVASGEKSSDVVAPVLKKSKGSESPEESTEEQPAAALEFTGSQQATEELFDSSELPQGQNEEGEVQNEDGEIAVGNDEESKDPQHLDGTSHEELPGDRTGILDENPDQPDEMRRDHTDADNQQSILAPSGEREEGELLPDAGDLEGGSDLSNIVENQESREGQSESAATPERSPARGDDDALEAGEINSPELSSDDKNDEPDLVEEAADGSDKLIDVNEPISVESDQVADPTPVVSDASTLTSSVIESSSSKVNIPVPRQGTPTAPSETEETTKQASPIGSTSTTINLSERARERAQMRQAGLVSTPNVTRGRGRAAPRGRGRGRTVVRRPPPSSGGEP